MFYFTSGQKVIDIDCTHYQLIVDELHLEEFVITKRKVFNNKHNAVSFVFFGDNTKECVEMKFMEFRQVMAKLLRKEAGYHWYEFSGKRKKSIFKRSWESFTSETSHKDAHKDAHKAWIKETIKHINAPDVMLEEFVAVLGSRFLVTNNWHTNLHCALTALNENDLSMRSKFYNPQECNQKLLNFYVTIYCDPMSKKLSDVDVWLLLMNYCSEYILNKFLVAHMDQDPDVYLIQNSSLINWFESNGA